MRRETISSPHSHTRFVINTNFNPGKSPSLNSDLPLRELDGIPKLQWRFIPNEKLTRPHWRSPRQFQGWPGQWQPWFLDRGWTESLKIIKGSRNTSFWEFPLWCSRLRIWHFLCSSLGRYWGAGLIPGPGTSTCGECGRKRKRKKKKEKSNYPLVCRSSGMFVF